MCTHTYIRTYFGVVCTRCLSLASCSASSVWWLPISDSLMATMTCLLASSASRMLPAPAGWMYCYSDLMLTTSVRIIWSSVNACMCATILSGQWTMDVPTPDRGDIHRSMVRNKPLEATCVLLSHILETIMTMHVAYMYVHWTCEWRAIHGRDC